MPDRTVEVLALAGSYRSESVNQALIRVTRREAPKRVHITDFDLRALPFFDADLEAGGDPSEVADLKSAIRAADALLIATPEYNGSLPAVLKNGIDWASRGHPNSALRDKPAVVVGATPGLGGTRDAQQHLRDVLDRIGVLVLSEPQLTLARAHNHVTDGEIDSPDVQAILNRMISALVETIDLAECGSRTAILAGCQGD